MTQKISAKDNRIKWFGHVSKEIKKDSIVPWRIPHSERHYYHPELVKRASMPAGVRLYFLSNTSSIKVLFNQAPERSPIDLVIDGDFVSSSATQNTTISNFNNLGKNIKEIELWLPQFGDFMLTGIEIDEDAELLSGDGPHLPKWITYGSSITQCRHAKSPTKTWPAIVSMEREYDLRCLGFGGQCHLDPMIAILIRDSDADLISLCLGINIYGANSLNKRTFYTGILVFIEIIREKHKKTPIFLISPIYSPTRETNLNAVGFNLQQMRKDIFNAANTFNVNGDKNISYINGLNLISKSDVDYLPDGLHPNNSGYEIMANNILRYLPNI